MTYFAANSLSFTIKFDNCSCYQLSVSNNIQIIVMLVKVKQNILTFEDQIFSFHWNIE